MRQQVHRAKAELQKQVTLEIESGEASVSLALALGRPAAEVPFFPFPYGAKTASELTFVLQERRVRGFKTVVFVPRGSVKQCD